ncbi:MAG: AI-2E family transporter [Chloroflexi bacterium]|nr:AI-2E family transporter [Chloroflexota bacterium]
MSEPVENNTQPLLDESPFWSRSTKIIVTVAALLLLVIVAYKFQALLQQLIIAAILAYLLNPFILLLDERTGLKRVHAILLVYLALAIVVVGALVAIGFAAIEQSRSLINEVPLLIEGTTAVIQDIVTNLRPFNIGTVEFDLRSLDWQLIQDQLLGLAEPTLSRSGQIAQRVATATLRLLGNIFFIFVISIYFAAEIPLLGHRVGEMAHVPGYRKDAERLMREFGRTWNAYLRGQVALALIIFLVVWIGLTVLRVQNSLALGLIAGLLEFIPVIGPVISAVAAVIVAFFQPDAIFNLAQWQYAFVVLGFMILVQQLENNILVPRIVGDALDLNPIVVMVAVFMGGAIAGVLGMILAAPVMASIKLVGSYTWRKMFDLPPFAEPESDTLSTTPSSIFRKGRTLISDLTKVEDDSREESSGEKT